jgi:hypothetical protein
MSHFFIQSFQRGRNSAAHLHRFEALIKAINGFDIDSSFAAKVQISLPNMLGRPVTSQTYVSYLQVLEEAKDLPWPADSPNTFVTS